MAADFSYAEYYPNLTKSVKSMGRIYFEPFSKWI